MYNKHLQSYIHDETFTVLYLMLLFRYFSSALGAISKYRRRVGNGGIFGGDRYQHRKGGRRRRS